MALRDAGADPMFCSTVFLSKRASLIIFFLVKVVSATAFAPAQVGIASSRVRRVACGLRMQSDAKDASEAVSEDAGGDGPKMSRAQRRMQEKYSKKNTDGSMKATQQVSKK